MRVFNTVDEIVEAIYITEDAVERKAAIRVAVMFAIREHEGISDDVDKSGVANKVLLSLLMLSISNASPNKKGGE